jgi:omega-6 fatty acid desaturase (delta-12 desaturase)
MDYQKIKQLRAAVVKYTDKSNSKALFLFVADMSMYIAAISGIIFLENIYARILCASLAGFKIASIFVIAHDAAHDSFVKNKFMNKVIARMSFLLSLHNYSLWLIAHNRSHHQMTNIKGPNSWSPLSYDDYQQLPAWRKMVERVYRTPIGIPIYYLVERWWRVKFYPYNRLVSGDKTIHFLDFSMILVYLTAFLSLLVFAGLNVAHTSPIELLILGFIIPMLVSAFMIGFTVYYQHTHETIPWFKSDDERSVMGGVDELTMHVRFPHWYNLISHNAMEHTAHHVDPRIPCYYLDKAQAEIARVLGDELATMKFSLPALLRTMKNCKLYDYEEHCWLNFNGEPTTSTILLDESTEFAFAA